jgi:tRNA uridine 5-carboxymethylaminomethyl modification enzyme
MIAGVRTGTARASVRVRVVLTTGTFLRGIIHIGETQNSRAGGRRKADGETRNLWKTLGLGLPWAASRPARRPSGWPHDRLGRVEMQPGDDPPVPFSFLTDSVTSAADLVRHHPHVTPATHDIIRANLHRAPMYSGQIASVRAALLPVDRGQGRAFRRQGPPPDFP